MAPFNFLAPHVLFGSHTAEKLGEHLERLHASRVLLISDRGLEKAGLVAQVRTWASRPGITVETFTDVEPEPSVETVRRCAGAAAEGGFDAVVGLGGGSAMDVAKTAAMLLGNSGDVLDYIGQNRVPKKGVTSILLPTTAGTGSEVGRGALFYVREHNAKESIFSPYMLTDLALIDPVLTASCPPGVTAASGIDALCHAIESYTSLSATPLSEPYGERGIELIARWLPAAVADGKDMAAREGMALGCLYASLSLANATSHAVHALAYPLQGHNRITHGLANGVLLPYVLEAITAGSPVKFARVAALMGADVSSMQPEQAAAQTVNAVRALSAQIHIPETIGQLGVQAAQLPAFTSEAYQIRRLMDNCPQPLSLEQVAAIFQQAL